MASPLEEQALANFAQLGDLLNTLADRISASVERESITVVLPSGFRPPDLASRFMGLFKDGWTYQAEIPSGSVDQRFFIFTRPKR